MRFGLLLVLSATLLFADGGKLLFDKTAGDFQIALFGQPSPLRAGKCDLSVMLRRTKGNSPVLDATVSVHVIRQSSSEVSEIFVPVSHKNADNKLLYAAPVSFPTAGRWRVEIEAKRGEEGVFVSDSLNILPPKSPLEAYWPYFAILPVGALLFAVNRTLRRRRNASMSKRT